MSKQLNRAEAARIAQEVNKWVETTQYKPTPEDTTIMKSVAASIVRVTIYKTLLGATAGAMLGLSLPRMIKSFKFPLSVTTSVGVLVGVAADIANRQRDSVSNWLKLQRNVNTPLTDKIYRTAAEVAPLSYEGKLAKAWLDQQTGQSPEDTNATPLFPSPPQYSTPPLPTPLPSSIPTTYPQPRRPGSGYYDVARVTRGMGATGPRPTEDPHKPGTGFYDVTQSGRVPPHSQLPAKSFSGDFEEGVTVEPPKPTPAIRLVPPRPQSSSRDLTASSKTKPKLNQYGDEITTAA